MNYDIYTMVASGQLEAMLLRVPGQGVLKKFLDILLPESLPQSSNLPIISKNIGLEELNPLVPTMVKMKPMLKYYISNVQKCNFNKITLLFKSKNIRGGWGRELGICIVL